jgi:hypothetical protein
MSCYAAIAEGSQHGRAGKGSNLAKKIIANYFFSR